MSEEYDEEQGSGEEEGEEEEGEEEEGEEEEGEKKEEQAPKGGIDLVSSINDDLDDLSLSIMMNFSTFSNSTMSFGGSRLQNPKHDKYRQSRDQYGGFHTSDYFGGRNRKKRDYPKDLIKAKEPRDVRPNDLDQDVPKYSKIGHSGIGKYDGRKFDQNQYQALKNTQDFGVQTIESQFSRTKGPSPLRTKDFEQRRPVRAPSPRFNPERGSETNQRATIGGTQPVQESLPLSTKNWTRKEEQSEFHRTRERGHELDAYDDRKVSFKRPDRDRRGRVPQGERRERRVMDEPVQMYRRSIQDLYKRRQKPGN